MRKSKLLPVVLSLFFVSASAMAEGSSARGGGDRYAAHFASTGKSIADAYGMICGNPKPADRQVCRAQRAFSLAVTRAKIVPRESIVGNDGYPREAGPGLNGNIELNLPMYKARITQGGSEEGTLGIIAHEYMIAAGRESRDSYQASSLLVSCLHTHHFNVESLVAPAPEDAEAAPAPLPGPDVGAETLAKVRVGDLFSEAGLCHVHLEKDEDSRLVFMTFVSRPGRNCEVAGDTMVFDCSQKPCLVKSSSDGDWQRVGWDTGRGRDRCPIESRLRDGSLYVADDGGIILERRYDVRKFGKSAGGWCSEPAETSTISVHKWRVTAP